MSASILLGSKPSGHKQAAITLGVLASAMIVLGVMIWQGITAAGNPDPFATNLSPTTVVMNTGIIVFREGLEAILVLAALTASLIHDNKGYWKPVALGAGLSFLATIATWFIVVAIISSINAPALHIQAATGLLAIIVLMVIMNWFFHKIYWTGWIAIHNRRKASLTKSTDRSETAIVRGLVLMGLTAVYREGFEVVLFLQSLRLKGGSDVVLSGVLIGLGLTFLVAILTFVAHYKLPYRKMLILTGVMLVVVLVVMVGESAQELQLAGWCSTTEVNLPIPAWMGLWLAIFPTVESLTAQGLALFFVAGSYFLSRAIGYRKRLAASAVPYESRLINPNPAD